MYPEALDSILIRLMLPIVDSWTTCHEAPPLAVRATKTFLLGWM